ncbi:peptidoglycan-binding protein [Alkalihalobacillus sp. 1P02AB]|uniref:peptidoglycan-binding protein n=1 Tax=Alkalihalobacillus sp. 1P02AB TaxID=3132260 RepID=UPI0039A5F660
MKTKSTSRVVQRFGLPLAAAGMFLLFAPSHSAAAAEKESLLLKGMEGSQVEELQEKLEERGFFDGDSENGVFGQNTKEAIKKFQKEHNLLVDGIAGPQTLGAISVLRIEDEGFLVETLQEILTDLDFYEGEINGEFTEETEKAVLDAQKDFEITVDGIAGPQTFGALYNSIYPSQKKEVAEEREVVQTSNETTEESTNSADNTSTEQHEPTEEGQTLSVEATAYTAECEGCSGITSTGIDLRNDRDKKVIAVDPEVIPLGSRVYVEGYGEAIAGDTGGAIQGNKIDLHVPTKEEAIQFGRQQVNVTILD